MITNLKTIKNGDVMSDNILVDTQGAKIGWTLLAVVIGSVATLYAKGITTESQEYTRKLVLPLQDRVSFLEFQNKQIEKDCTGIREKLENISK